MTIDAAEEDDDDDEGEITRDDEGDGEAGGAFSFVQLPKVSTIRVPFLQTILPPGRVFVYPVLQLGMQTL